MQTTGKDSGMGKTISSSVDSPCEGEYGIRGGPDQVVYMTKKEIHWWRIILALYI